MVSDLSQKQCFEVNNLNNGIYFLINMHMLSSPDVNCWTGVVWITVMLLSALILTAPIHFSACVATQTRDCKHSDKISCV